MAHSHREQEEAYVVAAGSGRALLDGEVVELVQWDVLRVAPEVVRAFEAGPDGLALIAIGANLGITSVYLQGIDNAEIIDTIHRRRPPMIPATAGLGLPAAP